MTGKKNDLVTTEAAAETLGMDEDELAEQIEAGNLRRVWHRAGNDSEAPLDSFVMGADVSRLQRESDPKYLAKLVSGVIQEENDEGDTPRSLAESVPRL